MRQPGRTVDDLSSVVIVSAADARFFSLLRDLVTSVRRHLPSVPMAVFDLGLALDQRVWLGEQRVTCVQPEVHFGLGDDFNQPLALSSLVRPFVREYLPGYELYLWLDADVWIQDGVAIRRLVAGALDAGLACVHERDPAYRFDPWIAAWAWKRATLAFGLRSAIRQRRNRQINAGICCIRTSAPHWRLWEHRFERAIRRTGRVFPNEQFALNEVIYGDRAHATVLDPENNWICDRALPAWDADRGIFVTPRSPHRRISILHLAGPAKSSAHTVPVVGGGSTTRWLTYSGAPFVNPGRRSTTSKYMD